MSIPAILLILLTALARCSGADFKTRLYLIAGDRRPCASRPACPSGGAQAIEEGMAGLGSATVVGWEPSSVDLESSGANVAHHHPQLGIKRALGDDLTGLLYIGLLDVGFIILVPMSMPCRATANDRSSIRHPLLAGLAVTHSFLYTGARGGSRHPQRRLGWVILAPFGHPCRHHRRSLLGDTSPKDLDPPPETEGKVRRRPAAPPLPHHPGHDSIPLLLSALTVSPLGGEVV